jgi:hypothetical protein
MSAHATLAIEASRLSRFVNPISSSNATAQT